MPRIFLNRYSAACPVTDCEFACRILTIIVIVLRIKWFEDKRNPPVGQQRTSRLLLDLAAEGIAEKIDLGEIRSGMADDVIRGRRVKKHLGNREMQQ